MPKRWRAQREDWNECDHQAGVRSQARARDRAARTGVEIFTAGIGRWWPKSHHIGASDLDTPVIEPRAGGRWFERGIDGVECEIGKVLVWDPPSRLVLSWQLGADFTFDPTLATEVEVRFIAEGENATWVELGHRDLERLGDRAEAFRQDSLGDWGELLRLFSQSASQTDRQIS